MKAYRVWAAGGAMAIALAAKSVLGGTMGIQGTMSNFDVFNETGTNAYGAELELDGVHSADVTKTYPCHFNNMVMTDFTNGSIFGTRIVFTGYNFTPPNPYISPRTGICTNGHYAVNLPGCEHFGFATRTQPTATSYFWLDQNSSHLGTAPMTIPLLTWTYVAPVGANPAVMQAVLVPPPPPPLVQYPDAVWVKTYVTELQKPADLNELLSYDPANIDPNNPSVAPQLQSEVEAEWELLPGDAPLQEPDIQLADVDQAVSRRFEFFQYTGGYDEVHLPTSAFTGGTPDPLELGQFIAANMVAANLVDAAVGVPEPSSTLLLLGGLGMGGLIRRRHRR